MLEPFLRVASKTRKVRDLFKVSLTASPELTPLEHMHGLKAARYRLRELWLRAFR